MKIIAHGINNIEDAKKALKTGADFIEIDVSKRIFFNKFTSQHNGLMGILGIGPMLETILTAEVRSRAFFDLKPVAYRSSFAHKLVELLLKLRVKNAKICGNDWQIISNISRKINAKPFYTIKNNEELNKLKRVMHALKRPVGLSVKHNLINKNFMELVKSFPFEQKIWAWTVNDLKEAQRLKNLGVNGIIADEWKLIATINN